MKEAMTIPCFQTRTL